MAFDKQGIEIEKLTQEREDCDETKDALKVAVGFAEKLDESEKEIIKDRDREIERKTDRGIERGQISWE